MLTDDLKRDVIAAMKRKDEAAKSILRVALGDIQTEGARQGKDLDDEGARKVLKKIIKSIDETLAAVKDDDTIAKLKKEKHILSEYMPKALGADAIAEKLRPIAESLRAAGGEGQAIGLAMKHLKSLGETVEGKDVAAAVKPIRS